MDAPRASSWPAAMPQAVARIEAAGTTDTGRARPVNEDSFLIATLQRSLVVHDASPAARGWFAGEPAGTLLVVADGMGGQGGGDVASKVGVDTVVTYLLNSMPWKSLPASGGAPRNSLTGVRDALSSALVAGDETVKSAGAKTGTPHMGTTLTMAFVLWPSLYIAHVGDTRCYLLRSGKLQRLTTDHTVAQQIAEISAKPVEPSSHLHHVLWNCLGGSDDQPRPEVARHELQLGDVLLLCSDGLTKHIDDPRLAEVLGAGGPCSARAQKLVELANQAGGSDNITAVVAEGLPADSSGSGRA
jgi:serine/threonine protein phosphatase PrpC